jgi:uncharacterized membrane protein YkoI
MTVQHDSHTNPTPDEEDSMQHRTKRIATAALVAAGIAAGTGFVVAAGGDDDDTETPITGDDLRRATAAALAHTGGGEVTGTEVGDEESRYEVEVTLDDGRQVDVQLDARFHVVGSAADDDTAGDD